MAQRLDDLEDNRIAQRRIGNIELASRHDSLGEFTRRHRSVHLKLTHANVGDLALLEEAVADEIARTLLFRLGEQPQRRGEMREVMFRLRDLRFISRDTAQNLGPHLSQRLNHQRIAHAVDQTIVQRSRTPANLVQLLPKAECLNQHWFLTLADACEKVEAWRNDYNEVRPHGAIGNMPPVALMTAGSATNALSERTRKL